jgi:spermidine/putrescine transport system permease protein
MKSNLWVSRAALGLYLLIFFGYLLGPLLVMSATAFNSSSFPTVSPWACFTFEWYTVLFQDERILRGIRNSFVIGLGTVTLSVAIGLAASLVLTQIWPRWRGTFYTIIIAPILIPGVVLGISTVVFWDRFSRVVGPSSEALFHNGLFLTILGQSTFIASYAMLVFVARLQRYDSDLSEAALDLGATHTQVFRKILLPFMRPAIASAAVLAFLASFENYNTTTFTAGGYSTLTIVLAQKVRLGINPSISALAFIIVVLTIFGAIALEAWRRGQIKAKAARGGAQPAGRGSFLPAALRGNWAALALVAMAFGAIATVVTAQSYEPAQCKQAVLEAKKAETARRIKELQLRRQIKGQDAIRSGPNIFDSDETTGKPSGFGSVFDPNNLEGQSGTQTPESETPAPKPPAPSSPFGNVFNPGNLEGQSGTQEPASPFGDVFNPDNLNTQPGTEGGGN